MRRKPEPKHIIGLQLRRWREHIEEHFDHALTCKELARRGGLSYNHANQIENGQKDPSITVFLHYLRGLGVHPKYFFTDQFSLDEIVLAQFHFTIARAPDSIRSRFLQKLVPVWNAILRDLVEHVGKEPAATPENTEAEARTLREEIKGLLDEDIQIKRLRDLKRLLELRELQDMPWIPPDMLASHQK
jgi:transcriptional regulator with XRE-family HTH domain